ncbi:nitroreductase family deazaflavin-dependent oxidoreductase [Frankia sp. AiPs1]|uniref:nitroreductase family deazaflavin-dependent oxidoreductase n=1 Tax=Frankia sp. AiPs1 TaxID=573493 RepID=UPI0020436CD3|nr:nitroreductase family deazaflavin-dependent oxidoreductase [Frankia sp. AiPs1]MCM3923608.1 nitroreductase family deazaflavin-dependent oxidoreductase [Frankia sp. AiPs1]
MADTDDFNAKIIADFRATQGHPGGPFAGTPILLLHTIGARTGTPRINPVVYAEDGDRYVVFASYAGAPKDPAWYHNLKAHSEAKIEIDTRTLAVRVDEVTGAERDAIYARHAAKYPAFAEYEAKAGERTIPVIALTPVSAT